MTDHPMIARGTGLKSEEGEIEIIIWEEDSRAGEA